MSSFKVCIVGVGSIGKRHIKNLRSVCLYRGINVAIDAYRTKPEILEGLDNVYSDIEDVPDDYDAIFITNPTDKHLETLKRFHNHGKHFFIEKPVVSLDQITEAYSFRIRKESVYYVAAPLRYNAVIQWIKNTIKPEEVISVRSISSSYLPDWRPGKDYRKTYSADKDRGGGVSIDLIHEWDYLTYLFGWPQKVFSMIGKKSHLEINSDDYAIYIAEYPEYIVELHLDYFGRKTIREVQLITNTDTIIGDIAGNQIRYLSSNKIIKFAEERDDYQKREIDHFLNLVSHKENQEDGFHHGLRVLEITQGGHFESID